MSEVEIQCAYVTAPVVGAIAAIAVTATSTGTDLSATNQLGSSFVDKGRFVTFVADGADVYLGFSLTDPAAVDPANVTAGNVARAWLLKDGQPQSFILRGVKFVEARTSSGTATLRCYVSSRTTSDTD